MYSTVTTVNHTVLNILKLLRVDLKHSHHKKMLTMWGNGYVNYLDLGNPSTISNHHVIYFNIIQLYLSIIPQ